MNGTGGFHDQGGAWARGGALPEPALNGGENRAAVNVEHASRLRENERDAHSTLGRWWPCEKAA